MTDWTAVNVLLVTCDQSSTIDAALAGLSAQVMPDPLSVVVADDASADDTVERIQGWAATSGQPCTFLPRLPRMGVSANFRRGFAACRSRYVAVLEGDDVWIDPERLARLTAFLDRHPGCPLAFNRLLVVDERHGSCWVQPTDGLDADETWFTGAELGERNFIGNFSACVYRLEALRRLPWPRLVAADSRDWLLNLVLAGQGPIGMLPRVMSVYRLRAAGDWSGLSDREASLRTLAAIDGALPLVDAACVGGLQRHRQRVLQLLPHLSDDAVPAGEPMAPAVLPSRRPAVSVVMTAYQHEPYVAEAVSSILSQEVDELELIVVDDGSTDGTARIVEAFPDPRIRLLRLRSNLGAAAVLNLGLQQVRADLVAVAHSDDTWLPGKLARQMAVLDSDRETDAVFTDASPVMADGRDFPSDRPSPYRGLFRQPDRTPGRWLRHFFECGNCLCHPSLLARRTLFERLGPYDNRLRQLPDFDMWIRLCKVSRLRVLDEVLVHHRRADGNTSSPTEDNWARTLHELTSIAASFFDGVADDVLIDGFGDLMRNRRPGSEDERACEYAWLLLGTPSLYADVFRLVGVQQLRRLLGRPSTRRLLDRDYDLDDHALHRLCGKQRMLAVGWRPWGRTRRRPD
jgi:glycosyltransferase involved in cell wall biosynthesis